MTYKKFLGAASAALMIVIVIFMLVPGASASKYKTLHKFTRGRDGGYPYASVIFDQAGNLYGTTQMGGTHDVGVVFRLTPNTDGSWKEKVLHQFTNGSDGGLPSAGLIFDQAGNLYGTTEYGGGDGFGVVFKLTPNPDGSWTESVLHSFRRPGTNGANPVAGLILDAAGNLYGTTEYGGTGSGSCYGSCGVVFKLTPNPDGSWTESVLHSFTGGMDGSWPVAGLIFDQAGNLYGTTAQEGYGGWGTIFELTPQPDGSWTQSVLFNFPGGGRPYGGVIPYGGLIFDLVGNLYGTTEFGTVFELAPHADGTWTFSVLYTFCWSDCSGATPKAGLIFDHAGNLYGTLYWSVNSGGCNQGGCGVVFKLAPNSKGGWHERVLHNFADRPGAFPSAGLIFDAAGNLYGTTVGDGIKTFGSVFEITP